MAKSCPHKVNSDEDFFFAPPKIGNHDWYLCMKFLYEAERACLVEVICLPYLLLVESSASLWNLDFRVFPKSLRCGDFNGVLQFFSSLLFMKKYNLKISPNFAICNIERFFGHRLDSSIKLTGRVQIQKQKIKWKSPPHAPIGSWSSTILPPKNPNNATRRSHIKSFDLAVHDLAHGCVFCLQVPGSGKLIWNV